MENDFIPIKDSDKGEFIIDEKYSILKKVTGNKIKLLEIYNSDLLSTEDIKSMLLSYPYEIDESKTKNIDIFYIKVFIFSEMPPETIMSIFKNAYDERTRKKNNFACMALCQKKRTIFFSKGIVYPNHMIYDVFANCFDVDDKNAEFDIIKILAENEARNKPQIIVENEGINTLDTFSFKIVYFYIMVFMAISLINIFTSGYIKFFDSNTLFLIVNSVFLLTIGILVEYNFGNRKVIAIMLVGGIFSTIFLGYFIVYSFIIPLIGALMYMRYRIPETLDKAKFTKPILLLYLLFIVSYNLFAGNVFYLIPITGIIPGFCVSGILGFDSDIADSKIKKKLYTILLICVLVLCFKVFLCSKQPFGRLF
ncbi:rhomboid family intramembrane serine protease [Acetivibrio cellulolyticus]|uniref:rhomboid family intramembrane serine protease n=1 Tax=Acetivibrio cellulolyticus TaxID=35830 RepID=UPI0019689E21|nr:rhomboid family intramembrane serine protease [Acetivibrio cellulolyticus]